MNSKDLFFKLRWWIKEHLLLYVNHLRGEVTLDYSLPSEYGDFAVHPCVRYIKDGIGGFHWWLVLSPYPDYDTNKENVLLYHGVNETDSMPPVKWRFVTEVCGTHPKGFNSDPNLFYDGNSLWVIWREWETENVPKDVPLVCIRCSKTNDGVHFTAHETIAVNEFHEYSMQGDTAMCPIVYDFKGCIAMYASCYSYEPYLRPLGTSRYLLKNKCFKFHGFHHKDKLPFDLWHFDLFEFDGYLYQVATGQLGNAIYIGRSLDGKVFQYSKRPLYSYPWFIKKNFFYKPTAQIINSTLYVFFPRKKGRGTLRIVMRSMNVSILKSFKYE